MLQWLKASKMKFANFLKFLILPILVFYSASFKAQEVSTVKQRNIPFSLRAIGGLGNLIKPQAMRNNFYSVGDILVDANFGIYKGWNVCLNMRYTGFQIRQGASNVTDTVIDGLIYQVRTIHNMYTPGIGISYDKWIGDYTFFNFGLNAGYSLVRYSKLRGTVTNNPNKYPKSRYNYEGLLITPSVNFHYFFEENVAMSLFVSYSFFDAPFKPETIGLDGGVISYSEKDGDLKGNIKFISFGLGFSYSFKRIE
jgi:hypothetical protein